jgi:RNA polymerase sigma factor (sigma-70 family)
MEAVGRQIAAALAGAPEGREHVARRASTLALRTAAGVLGDRERANDVAQEVAVQVLRNLAQLREPAAFDAWVQRITVRETLRAARRERLRLRRERSVDEVAELRDERTESHEDGAALQQALATALDGLPPKQRLAVVLKYVHDMTEAEIAAAMDCPPGTVASLLSRGRAHLRAHPELAAFHRTEGVSR